MVREALTLEAIRELPSDEVAALFVTRRSEGLTPHEEDLLSAWLTKDEAHRRALDGADRAWNALDDAGDDEILAAMRAHALAPPRRAAWTDWRGYAAAAAVLVAIVGGAVILGPRLAPAPGPGGQTVVASADIPYASAVGQVKEVVLPDGTRMTLDADSAAVGRFSADGRSVRLTRGRAFFAVVHDAARPFTVIAADRRLVDVGTRFDVNLGPDALTVTLLEGRLAVGPKGRTEVTAILQPGQQLVSRGGQDQISAAGSDAGGDAAWRTGVIRFDNQSLAEAAAIMNRYSRDQIVIGDPAVAAIRVSGQFRAGRNQEFAETLAELYKLRSHRQADRIELSSGG